MQRSLFALCVYVGSFASAFKTLMPRCRVPYMSVEPQWSRSLLRTQPGTPSAAKEVASRVAAGESSLNLVPLAFPFELDDFQLDALHALHNGQSVVVSAPTGSGKTVIGEIGCYLALARGQRVIYTTPLKALSNQKFSDLQLQFGRERVGLLTGDTCINREGDVLVMTTEVYRSMLLRDTQPDSYGDVDAGDRSDDPPGLARTTVDRSPLDGVGFVVLDEFHYMNDPSRGTVWEECCILSPASIALVALSATIANTKQITSWLSAIHGPTSLVVSSYRPVPLRYYFADNLGLLPLFTTPTAGPGGAPDSPVGVRQRQRQWKMNPKLTAEGRARRELIALRRDGLVLPKGGAARRGSSRSRGSGNDDAVISGADFKAGNNGRRPQGRRNDQTGPPASVRDLMRIDREGERRRVRQQVPSMPYLVRALSRKDMVPAIIFIFSRAGCDDAARQVAGARHSLVTAEEALIIEQRVEAFQALHPALSLDQERLGMLTCGVAAHHAGMLPLEKNLVERLFQANLLKIIFATETLAAGVNMPARCTVISVISKRGNDGISTLSPSALLQMAGRAGRRGMDTIGHVVICRSLYEDAIAAHNLLLQPAEPISSHFFVSYSSALQMLRVRSPDECKGIVQRSFGAFLASQRGQAAVYDLDQVTSELDQVEGVLSGYSEQALAAYAKLQERITAERRTLNYLAAQDADETAQTIEAVLPFVQAGAAVLLTDGTPALLLDDAPAALRARLPSLFTASAVLVLRPDTKLEIVEPRHIAALDPELRTSPLPLEPRQALISSLPPPAAWVATVNGSLETASPLSGNELLTPSLTNDLPTPLVGDYVDAGTAAAILAKEIPNFVPSPEPSATVLKQVARIDWIQAQLAANEVHDAPEREKVLEAYRLRGKLEAKQARLRRKASSQTSGKRRQEATPYQGHCQGDDGHHEGDDDRGFAWHQFMAVCNVLRAYGALEEWTATELGRLVAEVAGENELWLALVMLELSDKDQLLPEQLAAVLAATLDERMRQSAFIGYYASPAVLDTLEELQSRAEVLAGIQHDHGVDFPTAVEDGACSLVEAWARGESWERLVANTSLDGGDLFRILRRTIELLRSVSAVPYVSEGVKRRASIALRGMNRYPVSDNSLSGQPSLSTSDDAEQQEERA